jgi:phage terminase small subunit
MPRRSAEDRSASYYRTGGKPPLAPSYLSPKAKRLWKDIVSCRPPELFKPGSQELLGQYCELCIQQEMYLTWLRDDRRNPELQATVIKVATTLCQLATKLRLALTSIDKRSGILTEREPEGSADNVTLLFGGSGPLRF